jgi:hypothetical protein
VNPKSPPIGFRVKIGGISGGIGQMRPSGIQSQRTGSGVHFEDDIDDWHFQALRLMDASFDSHQIGGFVSRTPHARFN